MAFRDMEQYWQVCQSRSLGLVDATLKTADPMQYSMTIFAFPSSMTRYHSMFHVPDCFDVSEMPSLFLFPSVPGHLGYLVERDK
jgi:hypothetical protein